MPGDDLLLDDSGDYVDDGAGGFELTPTAASALRHQMLDELGAWAGDPTSGREIRGISGRNNTEAEMDAEADSVRKALEVLEREGLITDVHVEVDQDSAHRFGLRTESTDAQSGGVLFAELLGEFGV